MLQLTWPLMKVISMMTLAVSSNMMKRQHMQERLKIIGLKTEKRESEREEREEKIAQEHIRLTSAVPSPNL